MHDRAAGGTVFDALRPPVGGSVVRADLRGGRRPLGVVLVAAHRVLTVVVAWTAVTGTTMTTGATITGRTNSVDHVVEA